MADQIRSTARTIADLAALGVKRDRALGLAPGSGLADVIEAALRAVAAEEREACAEAAEEHWPIGHEPVCDSDEGVRSAAKAIAAAIRARK